MSVQEQNDVKVGQRGWEKSGKELITERKVWKDREWRSMEWDGISFPGEEGESQIEKRRRSRQFYITEVGNERWLTLEWVVTITEPSEEEQLDV